VREKARTVAVTRIETVNVSSTHEQITKIKEDKDMRTVEVEVCYYQADEFVKKVSFLIDGENYAYLMSEGPDFAPDKPVNEYREIDLWHILDSM